MSAEEVLAQHQWGTGICICGPMMCSHADMAAHQLDVLKTAGYAVVELPKPDDSGDFYYGNSYVFADDGEVTGKRGTEFGAPDHVRAFAAALLAAADVAEAS